MTQELADSIKRLRKTYDGTRMEVINQLVELLAEMRDTLEFYTFAKGERLADFINRMEADIGIKADLTANKADALLTKLGDA